MLQSPGTGEPARKKKRVDKDKDKATTSKSKLHSEKPVKSTKDSKLTKDSTDQKLADLNQKRSDCFNRLEALLLAKTLDKEPTFKTLRVAPSHSPPAGVGKSTQPCIKPTDPATTPASPSLPGTDSSATKHQSAGKPQSDRPSSTEPATSQPPASHRQASRRDSISSLEWKVDSEFSDRPPLDLYVEEGELSEDQDVTMTDQDQATSEEQTYRETM